MAQSEFFHPSMCPSEWLRAVLSQKQQVNKHYSLRSFARAVGVPPGLFSRICSGKATLTTRTAEKIAARLKVPKPEIDWFLRRVSEMEIVVSNLPRRSVENFETTRCDLLSAVSDWKHAAIIALIDTDDFQSDFGWVAGRLQIDVSDVSDVFERLQRLELVRKVEGRFEITFTDITTPSDVPNDAIRNFHKDMLRRTIERLDEVPILERDVSSVTFSMCAEKLVKVKKNDSRF